MEIALEIAKVICLFLAVWATPINATKIKIGHSVSTQMLFYQAVGITGFIYLQWLA